MKSIFFALLGLSTSALLFSCSPSSKSAPKIQAENPLEELSRERPAWLNEAIDICDTAQITSPEIDNSDYDSRCTDRMGDCIEECKLGDGRSCYSFARDAEDTHGEISEQFFTLACKHGVSSGCTNRAAHSRNDNHELGEDCEIDLFRHSCDRKDTWGCAMLGLALLESEPPMPEKGEESRTALLQVCSLVENEDEVAACDMAKYLLGQSDTLPTFPD